MSKKAKVTPEEYTRSLEEKVKLSDPHLLVALEAFKAGRMEKFLTVKEVADALSVSIWTVYRLAENNNIPCVRVGSNLRFKVTDIEAYVKRRTTGYTGITNAESVV